MEERKGSEEHSQKEDGGEGGGEMGKGSLTEDGWLCFDICAEASKCLVTPLLFLPVCLLSQGRFEEPMSQCISSVYHAATVICARLAT